MIILKRYIMLVMLLLPLCYLQSESQKTALPKNIVNSFDNKEVTRAEIYQQISTILSNILNKKNTQSIDNSLTQIEQLLQLLNKDNKLTTNHELQTLFEKVSHLNPGPRKDFMATLPEQTQDDLQDKEMFEALHFFIKNKHKKNIWDASFWMQADKKYHFLRVFNRLLPKHLQLDSIYPLLDRINGKK